MPGLRTSGAGAPVPASSQFRRFWRWHLLAALLVVPFILWQSTTGVIYLWSEAWVDWRHPGLRFVQPADTVVPMDQQVDAARAAFPGRRVTQVLRPLDPARATQVVLPNASGLAEVAFVDPGTGRLLGTLDALAWPAGWSRQLHGGWPLGKAGSWLLELGAAWTIVMVLTGLYLWWPRDGRGWRALLPRLDRPGVARWRELHSVAAAWVSIALVGFLFTAMPWTHAWGGLLSAAQHALGQAAPPSLHFSPAFARPAGEGAPSLQALVDIARGRGLDGDLMLMFVDGPPGMALTVREIGGRTRDQRGVRLGRADGAVLDEAGWDDMPAMARAVATGVELHEARIFGRGGPWVNTAFAAVLVWLAVSGTVHWWMRRPRRVAASPDAATPGPLARRLGVPAADATPWPRGLQIATVALCLLLPLFGLSVLTLWAAETLLRRFMKTAGD